MDTALVNGRVLTEHGFEDGVAVGLQGDTVVAIGPDDIIPDGVSRHDLSGGLLMPGFIDIQVNGGGGVLLNDDPSLDTIRRIGAAHRRFGTTGFLPTLISDDLGKIQAAIEATDAAIAAEIPGVLGLHIEGPFLNPVRKGAHDVHKFRVLDEAAIGILTSMKRGVTLVTIAPEMTTLPMIERLRDAGVVIAAGHTDADYDMMREALDHGVTGFTHLFNAMSPLTAREPGTVGAALAHDESWCSLIVDGRHVDPATMRIALRCKTVRRLILATDAMPTVGSDRKSFHLDGRVITAIDGACYDAAGALAGSDLHMAGAVRNAVGMLGVSLADASTIASANPAQFLGLAGRFGRIAPGYRADLVLADDALNVLATWIAGNHLASVV